MIYLCTSKVINKFLEENGFGHTYHVFLFPSMFYLYISHSSHGGETMYRDLIVDVYRNDG
jgi:hypothetical protein